MARQRLNIGAADVEAGLIFSIHEGAVTSIDAVYDRGIPLIIDGDEPNVAALRVAVLAEPPRIPPGHVRTCCAEGLIGLGATPCNPVTADATGFALGPSFVFRGSDLAGGVSSERRAKLSAAGLLVQGI